MANVKNSLRRVMGIDGAIGVALVDINDGLTLATAGGGGGGSTLRSPAPAT